MFNTPLEIANIREQCAWIYNEPKIAEKVCIDIITLSVKMSRLATSFNPPQNILDEKSREYLSTIEKLGPNPFKI